MQLSETNADLLNGHKLIGRKCMYSKNKTKQASMGRKVTLHHFKNITLICSLLDCTIPSAEEKQLHIYTIWWSTDPVPYFAICRVEALRKIVRKLFSKIDFEVWRVKKGRTSFQSDNNSAPF